MALSPSKKNELRERVKELLSDPDAAASAADFRYLRMSDPDAGYSLRNTLLLLIQASERGIDLQMCAGFREWLAYGRVVRKGEAGLFITAYHPGKKGEGDDPGEHRAYFGGTYVWDISQTDPVTIEDQP